MIDGYPHGGHTKVFDDGLTGFERMLEMLPG